MKKIIITEKQYHSLLELKSKLLIPQPQEDEMFFYTLIETDKSKLSHGLFFDCEQEYKDSKHPLWAWIQLNEKSWDGCFYEHLYIPITIDKFEPQIIGDVNATELTAENVFKIKKYIRDNYHLIVEHSKGLEYKCSSLVFRSQIVEGTHLKSRVQYLLEMANFPKQMTGLPVNVWYVEGSHVDGGHADRIKVQNNYGDKVDKSDFIPFTLWGKFDPIKIQEKDIKLDSKTIELVKKFIEYNYHNLSDANKIASLSTDNLIKIDSKGNAIYPKGDKFEYTIRYDVSSDGVYKMVEAGNGLVNILNTKTNRLVSAEWFKQLQYFQNNLIYVMRSDNKWYKMDMNGKIYNT